MISLIKIKNRKAQSHIEVIISFVIFITFLIFIFTLFNPLKKQVNSEFADSVFVKIKENTSTVLSSFSINLKTTTMNDPVKGFTSWTCIMIPPIDGFDCGSSKKLIVKRADDIIVPGFVDTSDGNKIKFEHEKDLTKTFYTFYCGENLTENHGTFDKSKCMELTKNINYTLGIVVSRDLFSEDNLNKFKEIYDNDYSDIKNEFVPSGNDFGILVFDESGIFLNVTKKIPRGINIDSQITPIDLVNKNAEIKKATVNVLVW